MFSPAELRQIAASAATTYERMEGPFEGQYSDAGITGITEWCRYSAHGDPKLFAKQLRALGQTVELAKSLLGRVVYNQAATIPDWVGEFIWVVEHLVHKPHPMLRQERAIAFSPLFNSLVDAADQRVSNKTPGYVSVSSAAQRAFRLFLYRDLASLCGTSLLTLKEAFQASERMYFSLGGSGTGVATDSYGRFLEWMREGGFQQYFIDYPVLARLVTGAVRNWIENVSEFTRRLEEDREDLRSLCGWTVKSLLVVSVDGGLSDQHVGGKSVWRIHFEDGSSVLYKPKNIGTEAHWSSLLDYLADAGSPPSARPVKIINREGYGWSEYVDHVECRSVDEVSEFFRRAGATLCLLRILGATDIHFENVIAAGQDPTVVDLETLFQPTLIDPDERDDTRRSYAFARDRLRRSVLASGFLPTFLFGAADEPIPIGALSIMGRSRRTVWAWQAPNTDSMRLILTRLDNEPQRSLPLFQRKTVGPNGFVEEICDGFSAMYGFLLDRRAQLLDANGPLARFRNAVIRVVLRPTEVYSRLLRRGNNHVHYKTGVSWSAGLDMRSNLHDSYPSDLAQLVQRAEVEALAARDVPYFATATNSLDLVFSSGRRVERFFVESGFERVTSTIIKMCPEREQEEIRMIRATIPSADTMEGSDWSGHCRPIALKSDQFLAEAVRIAEFLKAIAITTGTGATWIGVTPLPRSHASRFDVVGYDLYSGTVGIALFLAAVGKAANREDLCAFARTALMPLRSDLKDIHGRRRLAAEIGLGGAAGVSSILYCLVILAETLGDESLLDAAASTERLVWETPVDHVSKLDVVSGTAGCLLSMLRFFAVTQHAETLQKSKSLGDELVQRQDADTGAWRTFAPRPLCGFSHGAAGICLALVKLHHFTGDGKYLSAARTGWAYERRCFSAEAINWPDYRGEDETIDANGWCHGACGIGLARLAGLKYYADESALEELAIAIRSVRHAKPTKDHLCCGSFGLIELLASASNLIRDESLLEVAHSHAAILCREAVSRGSYRWPCGRDYDNPGFFTGLAGVGYTLLRLRPLHGLPCVITWS